MASPPVAKFLDFGQYKYDLTKREKEAKRKQRSVTFKEVRLSPKIGTGDFDTKTRKVEKFLEEGHKVKVTIMFRGRETQHPELGRRILDHVAERVTPSVANLRVMRRSRVCAQYYWRSRAGGSPAPFYDR